MIGKLTGRFDGTTAEGAVLIDVNGVGYIARVPLFAVESLRIGKADAISLYIHTAVREDAIDLYGFPTEEELQFFKQLMSVSGIGPKTALGILNASDILSLKRTIAQGDSVALTKVFGVGKKSAERIVVELKDKVVVISSGESGGDGDVIEALMAMGYTASEARSVLKSLPAEVKAGTVNEKIAAALKLLGTKV
jgi:holliday junction DNA helicase RuvA